MAVPKKLIFGAVAAAALLGGAAYGVQWWLHGRFIESTNNAYVEADTAVIAPKVAGYIKALPVSDNERVAARQVLAVIDDQEYRAAMAEAVTAVATQRAAAASAAADLARQHSAIAEEKASVASAKADWARAKKDLDRYGALRQSQFVSTQRFDSAVAEEARTSAAIAEAEARLASAQAQLAVLGARKRQAEAGVAQAQAAVQAAQVQLDATTIRAPQAGVIGNRTARAGQYVRPGQQMMAVVPLEEVYIVANFKETQIEGMRAGQPVAIHVDAYPDVRIQGRIDGFSPASGARFSLLPPENATGNFTKIVQRVPVKITFRLPADSRIRLAPGMSVEAVIDIRDRPQPVEESSRLAGGYPVGGML